MKSFLIEGTRVPLGGQVTVSGNKNAVLPMIAASILTDKTVILHNVPNIVDVSIMLKIAQDLGTSVNFSGNTLTLSTPSVQNPVISREYCTKVRTSLLFAGPLINRAGHASLWPPGGDVIGRRRLDGHFYGLISLGAQIEYEEKPYTFKASARLKGRDLFLDEASVTATEHLMMTAVLAEGQTTIRNAACEPHVCDLGELLIKMGANISGLGTNTITIEGVDKLNGAEHTVQGDHIEAASFLCLSAATGGELNLKGITTRHFWMTRRVFERFNVRMELYPQEGRIFLPGNQELEVQKDFGNAIPTIDDGPWPQFPTDMMSCMIVMATQAKGTIMFFEKMFESRIYFVDKLIAMGATAIVCDPHRAVISGPTLLRASELPSPDIRSGMALLIAAMCAKGKSTIHNVEMIQRGYENLEAKLTSLGSKITPLN
ncbi:MAG TPA: UDP-N-acetylglucosamine 1-carboxyvinyltransferase [Lentisphaeria bacterium]|nr:MAG: UDP-N-acetylglucosamine 1-carboxyvinyltransferase [Lentisphaerae bacterium GWF2_38_69]HBM17079.1 UDP-N-acetylglucosamine 1-carboxyvinyltransferase [Lentisphaeria bacterium]